MIRKILALHLIVAALLALSACGSKAEPSAQQDDTSQSIETVVIEEQAAEKEDRLSADYTDALSVPGQLALGTLKLEETDLAVNETQAAELLTLWQAYQSLSTSDTAAAAEIMAVTNQIQATMNAGQIQAIADMALKSDSLAAMIESGELTLGGFGFRGAQAGEGGDLGGFGAGFPGGFPVPEPGGGAGGRQGGGSGGFFVGGPGGQLSEDDIATRQAQFASGDLGDFQERALTRAVVVLLQNKTGQAPEPQGFFDSIFTVVGDETGLSLEELRALTGAGTSLAQIIQDNGGDVDQVRQKIIETLSELPNASELNLEQLANGWLGLGEAGQ